MIHHLEDIARNRFLNLKKFQEYITLHGQKYICDGDMVSTWHVDPLLKAYREHIGDTQYMADRAVIIEERWPKKV